MSECVHREVKVELTIDFELCTTHGMARPNGSTLASNGIHPQNFLPVILGVVEETLTLTMTEDSDFKNWITKPYHDGFDGVESVMSEREQKRIAKLLAHQYLLRQVADRTYVGTEGALLSLPFDPGVG